MYSDRDWQFVEGPSQKVLPLLFSPEDGERSILRNGVVL